MEKGRRETSGGTCPTVLIVGLEGWERLSFVADYRYFLSANSMNTNK